MRRPKGYVGRGHETLGADLLAILTILKMLEHVLGPEEVRKLTAVDPAKWYPIEWLLELMETLDKAVGRYGLLQMGRALFKLSHEAQVRAHVHSARDLLHGIDAMYRHNNRGAGIGSWKVTRFEPGSAELEKTTPHHCAMEQGLLSAAFTAVGCPVTLSQSECFREGATACVYVISSTVTDERWSGIESDPRARPTGQRPD